MGTLDRLAAAGFSQQEMADYATQQHQTLSAAGFSPQEISDYLGGSMGPPASSSSSPMTGTQSGSTRDGFDSALTYALGSTEAVPAPQEPDHAQANGSFAQSISNAFAEAHNLVNVGTGKDALQTMADIGTIYGPVEAALNFATGVLTGGVAFPIEEVAKVAGILGAPKHITNDAENWANSAAAALTYQPRTEAGARLSGLINAPFVGLDNYASRGAAQISQHAASWGASPRVSALLGEVQHVATDLLPAVLGSELARKMNGQYITSDDMTNVAKVVAGPDAHPDTVQAVENSLRSTYQQTGIGPYTVLEQSRANPQIEADLKNPDVDVPAAFQQYARTEQVGVPVSDAMKAVRPLEAETPPPGPVEEPETELAPVVAEEAETATETPAGATQETPPVEGGEPQEGFGGAQNSQNLESAAPARTNTQLADALNAALKARDIDRAYAIQEAQIDAERSVIGNRGAAAREAEQAENGEADAQNQANAVAEGGGSFAGQPAEPPDTGPLGRLARERLDPQDRAGITFMHAGLSPVEAIENLRVLGQRLMQTDLGQKAAGAFQAGLRDLQMKTIPMAAGSERAMAIAKDAANAMRKAAWQWGAFDDLLKRGYTPEQRERMWNAAEEENQQRLAGPVAPGRGLASLTDDERQTVETLSQYGNQLLQRARDVGMFQGEGVPYWTPRMVAMIGEDGEVSLPQRERASSIEGRGGNVATSAGSLKGRQHVTVEETEAAAAAKFGEGATVVRDIRTMPLAMARIERAIAGRELVNRIKDVGLQIGQETVSAGEKPEFFTIDHPAFKTYRPAGERWVPATEAELSAKGYRAGNGQVWKSNPNTVNQYDPVAGYRVAADGSIERRETIMERAPLYVSKEFEGPLKAIMTEPQGAIYKGLMALKSKATSAIMYSPLIHNAVEWGRAMPMMPGKVLTFRIYSEGGVARNDPITMRRAIDAGLVPIGHRFARQDITGLLEEPNLTPGRSWTSKLVSAPVAIARRTGLASEGSVDAVRAAVDRAGDVWHNTLLWDLVAKLQMGLYTNLERDMIARGLPPQTASRLAAHFANRYAGALPNEAMSAGARKLANLTMFSRTFTLGNVGAIKDAFTSLPEDVQAQILRDAGEVARAGAASVARQKAIHALFMDVALKYVGNAVMQNAMDEVMRDKSLASILLGYALRFKDYLTRIERDPLAAADIGSIFPNSENEPGKEDRVFFKTAPDGTAIYMRLPTGKIGEEMQGWLTSPLEMLKRKESTIARPLYETLTNDKGFGRKVYDDQEPGVRGMLHAAGNIAWNILQDQIPVDSIRAGYRLMTGHGDDVDALESIGPLFGLTFSKGAPGGPEVGVMFNAEERHQNEVASAMPDIRQDIKDGDVQAAIQKMESAHMTPEEQRLTLRYAENPQARLNRNRLRKFEQIAPLDDLERMDSMQREEQAQEEEQQSPNE